MIAIDLPAFLPFYIGAGLVLLTGGWQRRIVLLAVPVIGLLMLLGADAGSELQLTLLGFELIPARVDRLSLLFGYLFHLAAFIAIVFSLHLRDSIQHVSGLCYAGSALGVVFAGDLISLFVFWELMAISSVFLIWSSHTEAAYRAGLRYLLMQVLSGMLLLGGAVWLLADGHSLRFEHLGLSSPATWLVFIAFGIKCGFPLLHNWLTDGYPNATPGGAVFLSAFTTKSAVYCLARGFAGEELLIYIGVIMTCFPIFYAVIENDLRRVLAYSMINQIGFMVCGIGIGTALAINGAMAHAFNDVIFKGLLMMAMGAVLFRTGRINGSDLGGLYRTMPTTAGLCLVGAASISAFPLFSGFVSKSMIMVAVTEQGYFGVWLGLLFASAGVFHHAGIKIPFFAFFSHDAGLRPPEAPWNMRIAMMIAALLCIAIGCFPGTLYQLLPFAVDYTPYDSTHVLTQLQLLLFSALAFILLKLSGLYPPELPSVNLDFDWLYRRFGLSRCIALGNVIVALDRQLRIAFLRILCQCLNRLAQLYAPNSAATRAWGSDRLVLGALGLLAAVLLFLL